MRTSRRPAFLGLAGDSTLTVSIRQFGLLALLALLTLRLGIGFHFFSEGSGKLRSEQPYSAAFFANAKGPLAPLFRSLVWDADGLARLELDDEGQPAGKQILAHFCEQAIVHYGFNDEQAAEARRSLAQRGDQLATWLADNARDIDEYERGLARRNAYQLQQSRMQVAGLRGQVEKIRGELSSKRAELVAPVDLIWEDFEDDLYRLATPQQRERGRLSLPKPGRRPLDSESIDFAVRYFDLAIGGLLIVGLFTRVAALLGAGFLAMVIASQWPGAPGTVSIWPQFIEMLGLVVLAATGAGRFAGLDYIVGALRGWCCPPKQGTES